jgi:hypothetical protein
VGLRFDVVNRADQSVYSTRPTGACEPEERHLTVDEVGPGRQEPEAADPVQVGEERVEPPHHDVVAEGRGRGLARVCPRYRARPRS